MPPRKNSGKGGAQEPKLVVHNTFLEFADDVGREASTGGRRPRAQTDLTDGRMARKVSYRGPESQVEELPYPFFPGMGALGGVPPYLEGIPEFKGDRANPLGYDGSVGVPPPLMPPYGTPGGFPPFPGFPAAFPPFMPHGVYPGMPPSPLVAPGPWGYPSAASPMTNPYSSGKARGRGAGKGERQGERRNAGGKGQGSAPVQKQQPEETSAPKQATGPPPPPVNGTTVMLRNIPNRYTQGMLVKLLDDQGFKSTYDFVYLPMDFRNGVNLGYAFVNLVEHPEATRLMNVLDGFSQWCFDSDKVCEVSWAHPHQGLKDHVERYRNSPVMHPTMPEDYKPMVFQDGIRVAFPTPTKAIRAPKLRPVHNQVAHDR